MNPYTAQKVAKQADHGSPSASAADLPLGTLLLLGPWRLVERWRKRVQQRHHDAFVERFKA